MLFGYPESVTASSCFSGFFRRVLCKNLIDASEVSQLSTYDEEAITENKSRMKEEMGLKSMPEFDWMSRIPDAGHGKSPGKVKRAIAAQESTAPAYLLQEDEEFLLLSFDCHVYREKKRDKARRKNKSSCNHKKMSKGYIVRGRKRVDTNEEDDDIEIIIQPKSSQSESNIIIVSNGRKEMEISPEKQSESDSSSENSSPVSVLDPPFGEDNSFLAPDLKLKKGQDQAFVHHLSLWRGNSTDIEDNLLKNLNWVLFRDCWRSDEEHEEMSTEIELQILDHLVHDLANELLHT